MAGRDGGHDALPFGFAGDVERIVHARLAREIGADDGAARRFDGLGRGRAERAGGPGDQDDVVFQTGGGDGHDYSGGQGAHRLAVAL